MIVHPITEHIPMRPTPVSTRPLLMTSLQAQTKGLKILIILALVTFFTLSSGCTQVPGTVTTGEPDSAGLPQTEQHTPPGKSWITIHPISNITRGEIIRIQGLTDLPVGTKLGIQVFCTECFNWHQKSRAGEFYGNVTTTSVVPGSSQGNAYSAEVDTSAYIPDEYQVSVQMLNEFTNNKTHFFVMNTSEQMRQSKE
jgi:hypothetical protein